jgi:hypothetical protein
LIKNLRFSAKSAGKNQKKNHDLGTIPFLKMIWDINKGLSKEQSKQV